MDETYLDVLGFKEKEFATFCGAGISKNSGLPLANELKRYILGKLPIDDKDIEEMMASNLPLEAFMESISDNTDISRILEIFENGDPNTNHILIARLAKNSYIKTIFTTNFDLLIEKALEKEGLKRGKDFEVYCNEEQFSEIDFEDIEDEKIRILKIHGSIDNRDSIRTTMKAVASKTLSDKRTKVIGCLFSTGRYKKVLILGYSCSDEFDITPQIQSIKENQKEIIFVEHSKEGKEIEDIGIKEEKNPFKTFPGKRIKCNTDGFIRNLWDSLKETIGEYEFVVSQVDWKTYLNDWAEGLKEEPKYFIAALTLNKISNLKRAIEYHERVLEIVKAIGNKNREAACYRNLGIAYHGLGDFKKAIEYHEKCLEITKATGKKGKEAKCYRNLGIAYHGLGDFKKAIEYYERDLEIAKAIGDKKGEAACYTNLGVAYLGLEDFQKAIEYYEKALEIAKVTGDKAREARYYGDLGNACHDLGDFKKAIEYHERDLEIAKAIGDKKGEAACYANLADVYYSLGDSQKAIEYLLKAEKIFSKIGLIRFLRRIYRNLALAYEKIGDNEKAKDYKRRLSSE